MTGVAYKSCAERLKELLHDEDKVFILQLFQVLILRVQLEGARDGRLAVAIAS